MYMLGFGYSTVSEVVFAVLQTTPGLSSFGHAGAGLNEVLVAVVDETFFNPSPRQYICRPTCVRILVV